MQKDVIWLSGGIRREVGVTCDVPSGATTRSYTASTTRKTSSPSSSTKTATTIKRSTPQPSSYAVQSTESTSHFSNNINTNNSMSIATTIAVLYSWSIESTQDDPKEMICKYTQQFNYQPFEKNK